MYRISEIMVKVKREEYQPWPRDSKQHIRFGIHCKDLNNTAYNFRHQEYLHMEEKCKCLRERMTST